MSTHISETDMFKLTDGYFKQSLFSINKSDFSWLKKIAGHVGHLYAHAAEDSFFMFLLWWYFVGWLVIFLHIVLGSKEWIFIMIMLNYVNLNLGSPFLYRSCGRLNLHSVRVLLDYHLWKSVERLRIAPRRLEYQNHAGRSFWRGHGSSFFLFLIQHEDETNQPTITKRFN